MNGITKLRGLSKWKLVVMVACAASTVCVACAIAALIFSLMLADKNSKSAITSTAKAEMALAAAQTETARPAVTEPVGTPPPSTLTPLPGGTSVPPTEPPMVIVITEIVTVTPAPDKLRQVAEATYKRIVYIQLYAQDLAEIARQRAAGEISALEAGVARLTTFDLIQAVEEIFDEAQPPAVLESAWEQALEVHEDTKAICAQWLDEEIDSSEVAETLGSVLDRADVSVQEAAQVLIDHYGFDTTSVEELRQQAVQEIRQLPAN